MEIRSILVGWIGRDWHTKVQKLNFEAPSKKMELKIAAGFEAEIEALIGGLIHLYIKHILAVVFWIFFFFF